MGSPLRSLVLGIMFIPSLLMTQAVALPMDSTGPFTSHEFSVARSYQPKPLGIPHRRFSGGTR